MTNSLQTCVVLMRFGFEMMKLWLIAIGGFESPGHVDVLSTPFDSLPKNKCRWQSHNLDSPSLACTLPGFSCNARSNSRLAAGFLPCKSSSAALFTIACS